MTPEEIRAYNREHYQKNKDKLKADSRARYEENKAFVYSHKSPCIVCDEDDPVVIDFHHIDPKEKEFNISRKLCLGQKTLKKEIDKCVCLCANCHRRVHAGTIEINLNKPESS